MARCKDNDEAADDGVPTDDEADQLMYMPHRRKSTLGHIESTSSQFARNCVAGDRDGLLRMCDEFVQSEWHYGDEAVPWSIPKHATMQQLPVEAVPDIGSFRFRNVLDQYLLLSVSHFKNEHEFKESRCFFEEIVGPIRAFDCVELRDEVFTSLSACTNRWRSAYIASWHRGSSNDDAFAGRY